MMELGNYIFGNSRGEHPIDRKWSERFYEAMGDDVWDMAQGEGGPDVPGWSRVTLADGYSYITNGRYVVARYYWGDDPMIERLPNFIDTETGVEISWYKYPLRDSYSNVELGDEWWETLDLSSPARLSRECDGAMRAWRT